MTTYVCSDIHGHFDPWMELLETSKMNLDQGDQLVILGDLVDRGPKSKECVEFALGLTEKYSDTVHYIIGNHEKMLLDFLQLDPKKEEDLYAFGERWTRNGGIQTIASFFPNIQKTTDLPEILHETYHLFWEEEATLIHKLQQLPYYYVADPFVFVHAGFMANTPLADQPQHEMVWIRDDFYLQFQPVKGDVLENKTIIHGHTPVHYFPDYQGSGFYRGKHHIGVDGGAAANKNILLLRIDADNSITYQETAL